jgi:hypothetical protein
MKQISIIFYSGFLLCIMLVASSAVAQKGQPKPTVKNDTASMRLSGQIGVSAEKAKRIREAFNYKKEEIQQLLRDTTIKPLVKQEKLRKLMQERRQYISTVVDKKLLDTLKSVYKNHPDRFALQRQEMQKRSLEQFNQKAQRIRINPQVTDSATRSHHVQPKKQLH